MVNNKKKIYIDKNQYNVPHVKALQTIRVIWDLSLLRCIIFPNISHNPLSQQNGDKLQNHDFDFHMFFVPLEYLGQ